MINVLFVDDDPRILEGFKRVLRSKRKEWHMEFANSGKEAIEIMNQENFDVIFSDLNMQGIKGGELLNYVQSHFPKTARVIVSGSEDKESILEQVPAAQDVLIKPCQPTQLQMLIEHYTNKNK